MPRATWKKLPVDREKHPSYVEKILATSASNAVVDILSNHARRRDLLFRSDNYRTDVDLTSHISKLAAAVQTRGEVLEGRCSRCAGEECPFTECVHIPSEQYGRCGNCIYLRVPCSCGDANQSPFGAYLVQSHRPKADANFVPEPPGRSAVLGDAHVDVGEGPETPNNSDSSDRYVVLGDLVLPRPPAELKERAELYEKDLQALDARDMLQLRGCPIINLNDTFREFQSREEKAWKSISSDEQSPSHLVRPSGSLDSPLAHRLNQPSFSTDHPEDGETADNTNGCIAMVMGNVYKPGHTLLFDHIHRRDHQSEAIEEYDAGLLSCHEGFTNDIAASMTAKVEIIYGAKVQRRLLLTQDFDVLPLWGDFEGVVLLLAHEKDYCNGDTRFRLRRVMLMACHPHHMFYQPKGSAVAIRQDKTMVAAALMVRNSVPLVKNYFAEKKWFSTIPSLLRNREISALGHAVARAHRMPPATIIEQDDNDASAGSGKDEGDWASCFYKRPHSNNDLRKLIPLAFGRLGGV